MLKHALIVSAALIALPLSTFAATPQQILNNLPVQTTPKAQRLQGVLNLGVKSRENLKNAKTEEVKMSLSLDQRLVPNTTGSYDSEGRLALNKLESKELPFSFTEAFSIQWKWVNKRVYLMIDKIPTVVLDYARKNDVPLSDLMNRWFVLDASFMDSFEKLASSQNSLSPLDLQKLSKDRPFIAVRQEKTWKNPAGEQMVRIRARLNPSYISKMQAAETAKLDKKSPFYASELKELRARQAKIASTLRNMIFALEVNTTKNQLSRVEIAGAQTETQQDCVYNAKSKRDVCKLASTQYITYATGFSFLPDTGVAIEEPFNSTNLLEYIDSLVKLPGLSTTSENSLLTQ